jgi:3-methyladenine DNA glycosylase AlkD
MIEKEIEKSFQADSQEAIAIKQKAYMRDQFEFLGLTSSARRQLQKVIFRSHPVRDEKELIAVLERLWEREEREYHYCALDLAKYHRKKWTAHSLPVFEKMIRCKSWWDTVDDLAINLVGPLLNDDLLLMDEWIQDPYLWIRRSALICQIKRKAATDATKLFTYCQQTAHEKDFFIRKAIGWALREYAKYHPQAVRNFLENHQQELSGLSQREASKYL